MIGSPMPETTLTFLHTGNPTGLKFSVEHGGWRCLFDFGLEYAPGRALFSHGLSPRTGRELGDLLAVGAAPRVAGIYAGGAWDQRTAIFISHLHLDHTGLVRFLERSVPLHYPAAMEPVRAAASATGYLPWRDPVGTAVADRSHVSWGALDVEFVAVDHDVPGASGFLIRTPDLFIAFTGDQRWHGLHPELCAAFAEAARACDVLIQEGVFLGLEAERRVTEREVVEGFPAVLASHAGLVVVNLTPLNRERVAAFAAAAREHGRRFVMEPNAAVLAGQTGEVLTAGVVAEAKAEPGRFVIQLSYESLPALIDLAPPPGSAYVHSNGPPLGPFDPAYGVMEAWVGRFGMDLVGLGSSGHAYPEDIVRNVLAISPGLVIPVHSMAPDQLSAPGVSRLLPEVGRGYRASDLLSGSRASA
jgi:ribonuclease J